MKTLAVGPRRLRHWKICFLPKATTRKGVVAGLGDVRPISVGPTAYRIWAAIRLQNYKSFVEGLLCQEQAGCNGLAAQDLLLTMENKYQAQDWPYAMALDLQKAFDTTDWTVCLKLLKHAGLQAPILKLLQDQWDHHERWLSYRGAIDPAPLKNTAGLPQGDPWSPIAMSALMGRCQSFRPQPGTKRQVLNIFGRQDISRHKPTGLEPSASGLGSSVPKHSSSQ